MPSMNPPHKCLCFAVFGREVGPLVMLGLLASLLLVACGPGVDPASEGKHRVILILLDAARADRMTPYGYRHDTTPELDRLAREGTVFERHYSADTATRPALPPMFYSRYFAPPMFPYSRSVPYAEPEQLFYPLGEGAVSLPAAFEAEGFATAMISAHGWTIPRSALARQFGEVFHLPDMVEAPPGYPTPRANQVVDEAIRWIDGHTGDDFFLYLHLMDTHFPHHYGRDAKRFLPRGVRDRVETSHFDGRRALDTSLDYGEDDRLYLDALYDGSLYATDRELGRLFDHLKRRGLFDGTVIAITSDHGEHLLEHPDRFEHGGPWYEKVAHIPLLVRGASGLPTGATDTPSHGVDVMPTLLAAAGIELAEEVRLDGRDLGAVLRAEVAERRVLVSTNAAIHDGRYKAVFRAEPATLWSGEMGDDELVAELEGELYDLEEDPGETVNLWGMEREKAAELLTAWRAELERPWRRSRRRVTNRPPDGPFAIATRFLQPGRPVAEHDPWADPAPALPSEGWIVSDHWQNHQLFAHPGAAPLELSLDLPDGRYRVGLALRGAGRVSSEGGEPTELSASIPAHFDPSERPEIEELDWAEVEVRDQHLRFTLEPLASEALLVRYMTFEPLTAEAVEPAAEDDEHRRRLESLGYID